MKKMRKTKKVKEAIQDIVDFITDNPDRFNLISFNDALVDAIEDLNLDCEAAIYPASDYAESVLFEDKPVGGYVVASVDCVSSYSSLETASEAIVELVGWKVVLRAIDNI